MINALFALINFLVFAALVAYIVHKKVIPRIAKALVGERSEYDNEQKDLKTLQQAEQKLLRQLQDERQLAQELVQKITQWQQVLDHERGHQQQLLTSRQQQIVKRRQQQEYEWLLQEQQKQLLPEVLAQTEHEVRLKMHDVPLRESYFAKAIHSLQRNVT